MIKILQFVILVAASLTMALVAPDSGERELDVELAYICSDSQAESAEGVPVIMLHGLTGTKETWDKIYQNISLLTHRRVYAYDLRNHGDSGWSNTFNVDVLADDLKSFMHSKNIEKAALVGHSLGGLAVMKFALKNPSKVQSLFVEDMSPIRISDEAVENIRFFLQLLVSSISAIPKDADEETAHKAVSEYICQATGNPPPEHLFKKFPFRCRDGVWHWKCNVDACIKAFDDTKAFMGKMEGRYDGKVFFIYGKTSFINVADDIEDIKKLFPNAEFYGVEGASHVIHSQHPEFQSELVKFLKSTDLWDRVDEESTVETICS